jgi:hypothetical protein
MLLFVIPILLLADDGGSGVEVPSQVWLLLAPIIATLVTSYGVRLFKWLGIPIEDHLIYPVLIKLIEMIAGVDGSKANLPGALKKGQVVDIAKERLKPSELKLLNRRFGSIDTAVQAAFEMSSTAKKRGK